MPELMRQLLTGFAASLVGMLLLAAPAKAQGYMCEEQFHLEEPDMECYRVGPAVPETEIERLLARQA